jgi:beta-aspartyl-peptidase (threonine type)
MRRSIFIHGGTSSRKSIDGKKLERYREGMREAARRGFEVLRAENALTAVVTAVAFMEDADIFNAGQTSCLNASGEIEMDAAVMDGRDLDTGAVGAVRAVRNAVVLARRVMEETDHVLLVGEGADRLSLLLGLDRGQPEVAPARLAEFRRRWKAIRERGPAERAALRLRLSATRPELDDGDTVGAVAVDRDGNVAAAVSTGGLWLKLPGRVGDSAVVGAGLYADNRSGAASATGIGEVIMKTVISKMVCDGLSRGLTPREACRTALDSLACNTGSGRVGVIALDRAGRPGFAFNTFGMGRAYLTDGMAEPSVAIWPEDPFPVPDR